VENPRGSFVAGYKPTPDRKTEAAPDEPTECGTQPAHKSMSTVVESPVPNFAHELHAKGFINTDGRTLLCPKLL